MQTQRYVGNLANDRSWQTILLRFLQYNHGNKTMNVNTLTLDLEDTSYIS